MRNHNLFIYHVRVVEGAYATLQHGNTATWQRHVPLSCGQFALSLSCARRYSRLKYPNKFGVLLTYSYLWASLEDRLHLGKTPKNIIFFGFSLNLHYLWSYASKVLTLENTKKTHFSLYFARLFVPLQPISRGACECRLRWYPLTWSGSYRRRDGIKDMSIHVTPFTLLIN